MKLKPEVKTAWVSALRSGEYTQTSHVLSRGGKAFCCLGVLCDLAVKEGYGNWMPADYADTEEVWYEGPGGVDTDNGVPPDSIVEWAFGQWAERPWKVTASLDGDDLVESFHLADLNDQHGYTFDMIADLIEEQM